MAGYDDDEYTMTDNEDEYSMSANKTDNVGLEVSRGMRRRRPRCECNVNIYFVPMGGMAPMAQSDFYESEDEQEDPEVSRRRRRHHYWHRRPWHRHY